LFGWAVHISRPRTTVSLYPHPTPDCEPDHSKKSVDVISPLHYTLRKALADDGLAIDEGTLYPLLRRLETQGLLVSQWREQDKRNKRFYRLSPAGDVILGQLLEEWQKINTSLGKILQEA